MVSQIAQREGVTETGFYYELGYVSLKNGSKEFKASAYQDAHAEQLYYMPCIKGNYPSTEDEVALDTATAKAFGISPYPGEQVELTLYDLEKEVLETRTFTVSGIFGLSDTSAYGGYYRYPGEFYTMPTVVMHPMMENTFHSDRITLYVQTESEDVLNDMNALEQQDTSLWCLMEFNFANRAYAYVLGIENQILGEGISMHSISQAMQKWTVIRDFYSAILMPVFVILVLCIVLISVVRLIQNVLKDRTEMVGILRSLGLSATGSGIYLMAELLILSVCLSLVGILAGMGLHVVTIAILNQLFHVSISTGLEVSEYVKQVTYHPYWMPLLVIWSSIVIAVLIQVQHFSSVSPISLFQGEIRNRKKKQRYAAEQRNSRNWMTLLNHSINLHDGAVMVMMMVVMGAAFFGYTYFSALAEKNNSELRYDLETNHLGNRDYLAKRSDDIGITQFYIENHHDYGISQEDFQKFIANHFVRDAYGLVVNQSSRLVYGKMPEEGMRNLLDPVDLSSEKRVRSEEEMAEYYEIELTDEFLEAIYDSNTAVREAVGYENDEWVYAVPTVGMSEVCMDRLQDCLVAGKIQWDKIQSGEEVVIAVPESSVEQTLEQFSVGDTLPMSDVLLSEEEERYDFGHEAGPNAKVYEKEVPYLGATTMIYGFAYGKRHDFRTKVGAVVAIPETLEPESDAEFMRELMYEDLSRYPMLFLCSEDGAFSAWGLPDRLYTKVSASVADHADVEKTDRAWYQSLNHASGVTIYSVSEVRANMQNRVGQVMSIYYAIIIMLIAVGIVSIGINLYSRIRMSSSKIATLRATGMSLSQLTRLILRQNMFYPVIGAVSAVIPVAACQFISIKKSIPESGAAAWYWKQEERCPGIRICHTGIIYFLIIRYAVCYC